MKKLLAILLVLCMVFTLAACGGNGEPQGNEDNTPGGEQTGANGSAVTGTDIEKIEYAAEVFNSAIVKNTSGAVSVVNDLSNTYYKLKNNKKLTIGYTGGSVTDGSGGTNGHCWRSEVTDWFKQNFPDAQITEADGSQGNKSSLWGFFRADDWVKKGQKARLIDMKPDLVFLEFAINDYYVRMPEQRTIHYVEGIIKKIRKQLPETDIVLILITDEAYIGKEVPTAPYQKELAAHYGIPVIDVGEAMNKHLKSTGEPFKTYFTDNVHPNDKGYEVYAKEICKHLTDKLITNPNKNATLKNCEMPKNPLLSNPSEDSDMFVASELKEFVTFKDWKEMDAPGNAMAQFGPQLYGSTDSEMEFDFIGTGVSLMVDAPTNALVKCEIDGKETVSASVMNNLHNELLLVNNLTPGKHHIKIRIVNGKRFIIGALLIEK